MQHSCASSRPRLHLTTFRNVRKVRAILYTALVESDSFFRQLERVQVSRKLSKYSAAENIVSEIFCILSYEQTLRKFLSESFFRCKRA